MKYQIKQDLIPGLPQAPYTYGISGYVGVCLHHTAPSSGKEDTDESNLKYFKDNWEKIQAFAHDFVDYDSITNMADVNYRAWAAGRKGNDLYVHIELCNTKDSVKFRESYKRYVWLAAYRLYQKKLGVEYGKTLVTHDWVTKNLGGTDHTDPVAYLTSHGISIDQLIKDVKTEYDGLTGAKQMNLDEALQILNEKFGVDVKYWKGACDYVGFLRELFIKMAKSIKEG